MGEIIAVILLLIVVVLASQSKSVEDKALIKAKSRLPPGGSIQLDKRIAGKSRKGVVTYYRHFVRAIYAQNDSVELNEIFYYDHHNDKSKFDAIDDATNWIISTHTKIINNSSSAENTDEIEIPITKERRNRYGQIIKNQ